jgi:hypothetical protein
MARDGAVRSDSRGNLPRRHDAVFREIVQSTRKKIRQSDMPGPIWSNTSLKRRIPRDVPVLQSYLTSWQLCTFRREKAIFDCWALKPL